MRIAVLDSFAADQGEPMWEPLRRLGRVDIHPRTSAAELRERLVGFPAALTDKGPVGEADVGHMPARRYIGVTATGHDIIDSAACRARGIAVPNVPGYSTESVAQLVFAMVLHFASDV